MSTLFTKRLQVSPPEYPWAKEQYDISLQNAWSPAEVPMQSDIVHWRSSKVNDSDKGAIAGILRGFTVLEEVVGDHWANLSTIFPKPEIIAMCRSFSAQEWIHAYAYDLLETTLGIAEENWQAFQKDKNAINKLDSYMDYLYLDNSDTLRELAQGLAVFGACAEGISLFGSFAILLSFSNKGLFPGMNQLLSWSVRDENQHSNCALQLYNEVIRDEPRAKFKQKQAEELFDIAIDLEKKFIEPAFANGPLSSGVTYNNSIAFIYHRANMKLKQLGLVGRYPENDNPIAEWFYPLTGGVPINDFFVQRANGAAYSAKLNQDFTNVEFNF